jgi:hypothetical protein
MSTTLNKCKHHWKKLRIQIICRQYSESLQYLEFTFSIKIPRVRYIFKSILQHQKMEENTTCANAHKFFFGFFKFNFFEKLNKFQIETNFKL